MYWPESKNREALTFSLESVKMSKKMVENVDWRPLNQRAIFFSFHSGYQKSWKLVKPSITGLFIMSRARLEYIPKPDLYANRLKTLWESGLLTHWFKQYIPNIEKCLITTNNVAKVQKSKIISFNISQVSGIFLLLIVGLLLSILIFLGELTIRP